MAKSLIVDTLSEKDKIKLGIEKEELNLSVGSVHKIKMTEKDGITLKGEDKERGYRPKMAVVVAIKEDIYYATVLINSEPNTKLITEENITKDFHPIKMEDYSFIYEEYDPSFVDCGKIFSFTKERILRENNFKGHLLPQDCESVIKRIKNSERIELFDLIDYGFIEDY